MDPGTRHSTILGSIAVAILVLLVLLWRLVASGGGQAMPLQSVSSGSTETIARGEVSTDGVEGGGTPAGTSAGSRRDPVASSAAPEPTCRIRVVHAVTRAPVPEARVWIQREDVEWDSPEWDEVMQRFNDVEPVLQSGLGSEIQLDQGGEATVARPTKQLNLAAAHGELHGEATLEPDAVECVVEMKAYHSLAVEVVDRDGRPVAGAHVALFWGEFDPLANRATRATDELGRLWIPKLEEQIYPDGPIHLSLAGGVPCEPELVRFSVDSAPDEPVRFMAGDHGTIVVQLTDPRGKELALDGSANLEMQLDSVFEPSLAFRGGSSLWGPIRSGHAVFACVGLRLAFEVGTDVGNHDTDWREARGPTEPEEVVSVLVPVGEQSWTIARGRLSGFQESFKEGRPTRLLGSALEAPGWFLVGIGRDAGFEVPVQGARLERLGGPWTLKLSRVGGPLLRATVVPTIDEEARILDFGDVHFESPPLLTRARVVDESGAAVPWAMVSIQWAEETSHLQCDESGSCAMAAAPPIPPAMLRASHPTKLPSEWMTIDSPGTETVLTLRNGARVQGSLLLPHGGSIRGNLDCLDLELRVESTSPGIASDPLETELVEGGRFRFDLCEPGLATLSVSYARQVLFERSGIELAAGQTTDLEPIDLRSSLHSFSLTFELASGEPWPGGHFEVREPDGTLSTWTTIGTSARASFLSPRPSVDLWVAAKGNRPALLEGVLDGDRITLPGAPSLVLSLPPELRLPESPLVLMVFGERVRPDTVAYEDDEIEPAAVLSDGTATMRVAWPGDYELYWFVRHTGTGVDTELLLEEAQVVQVPDAPSDAVVEARLDPAELARAVLEAGG